MSFTVRHPSRTEDGKFHIVEDGLCAAKFDTMAALHTWATETIVDTDYDIDRLQAEIQPLQEDIDRAAAFTAGLEDMMKSYPLGRDELDQLLDS